MKIVFVYRAALVVLVALKVAHQLLAAEVLHRDEMLRYGNFVPDFFRRLSAPAITSMHVAEMLDCVINCLQNSLCFSFNLAVTRDINRNLLCQLLATDKYNSSDNFGPSQEFHFYGLASPCAESPCQHGGKCLAVYEKNGFKCKCPTGFSGVYCEACNVARRWHHHDNSCYKIFTVKKTWDDAKTSCKEMGASLLTIHSAGENAFVTETLLTPTGQNSIIALRDFAKTGTFVWADNSAVDFINWSSGEPNYIGYEDCSLMYSNGKWNNYPCNRDKLSYICEKP